MLEVADSDSMSWGMELNYVLEVVASCSMIRRRHVREVFASDSICWMIVLDQVLEVAASVDGM